MAFTGAIKVRVETSTSSSGCTPAINKATCSAEVPLTVATANCEPTRLAISLSKRSTNAPTEETQLVSRHSLTYRHSFPRISGTSKGMKPGDGGAPGASFSMIINYGNFGSRSHLSHSHAP